MLESPRHWVVAPPVGDATLASFPDLPPLIVQLLHNRGITEPEAVAGFLADLPPLTADPMSMKGMDSAINRLRVAVAARERVAVYGDFDADGITAAALLTEAFSALGLEVVPYIPQRADGYGLHRDALLGLASAGLKLVVTVDCGINSAAEIAEAQAAGLDVIVTDHHLVGDELPSATAVINPRRSDCDYPFKELAAVGVALKLAQAALWRFPLVNGQDRAEVSRRLLELVALGTVADVAPLVGENRALVRRGLDSLNRSNRPGLRALLAVAGLRRQIDSAAIGYALAPRLNAAGRVGDALSAYRLLVSNADDEASSLAKELEAANQRRQRMMSEALAVARERVLACDELDPVLLVAEPGLPPGIVGLVAGRLVEEFHRPAFVAEVVDGECRGSARSIEGFNVVDALAACSDLLTRFGGHTQAAGFSVPFANLRAFKTRLIDLAKERIDPSRFAPRLFVDAAIRLSAIDENAHAAIQRLAPFGHGNHTPVFLSRALNVVSARGVGRESEHLKLELHDGERYWPAIAFRMGAREADVAPRIDIVYTLELDEWNGRRSLELHLKDWRPAITP